MGYHDKIKPVCVRSWIKSNNAKEIIFHVTGSGKKKIVSEIINNQDLGRTNEVGAYQIKAGQLKSFVERGFIAEDDMFDEETQRKLGAFMLWERAGSFFSDASDEPYVPIPGLGQTWSGLKGDDNKFQEDERNVIANRLKKVKENLKAAGFDPLQFRDEINDTLFTLTKNQ